MYRIYADNTLIYDSTLEDYKIGKGQITKEADKSGSFVFSVYPDHPYYSQFVRMKTVVTVYKSGRIVFRGRILDDTTDYWNNKTITCEGELGFLQDSVARPFDFKGSPADLFAKFINEHNGEVDEWKQFKVGTVTVVDENGQISRSAGGYGTMLDTMQSALLDSALGGHFYITHGDDGTDPIPTLHYVADYPKTAAQGIEFGVNLKDYTKKVSAADLATCIIPLGASSGSDGERLTIEDKNGGKDYIYDANAVAMYGWIVKVVTWDDVTLDNHLLTKGRAWLQSVVNEHATIELNAIDLHLLDRSIESYNVCEYVHATSKPHGLDALMLCSKQTMDLLKPDNDTVTLGYSYGTFTGANVQLGASVSTLGKSVSRIQQEADDITAAVEEQSRSLTELKLLPGKLSLSVTNSEDGTSASIQLVAGTNEDGTPNTLGAPAEIKLTGLVTFSALETAPVEGVTKINGGWIDADTLNVNAANITGSLSSAQLNLYGDMAVYEQAPGEGQTWEQMDVGGHIGYYEVPLRGSGIGAYKKNDDDQITGMLLCNDSYAELRHDLGGSYVRVADAYIKYEAASYMQYLVDNTLLMELEADGEGVWSLHTSGGNAGEQADLGNSKYPWGTVYADTDTIETSDRNRKNSIENLPAKYVAMFDLLVPRRFKLNNGRSGRFHVGYVAQEVEEAMTAAGVESQEFGGFVKSEAATENGEDLYMLRYGEFGAIYAAKIKQLEARLATLEEAKA